MAALLLLYRSFVRLYREGGIVSAAVDGIRVGQSVAEQVVSAAVAARNRQQSIEA